MNISTVDLSFLEILFGSAASLDFKILSHNIVMGRGVLKIVAKWGIQCL